MFCSVMYLLNDTEVLDPPRSKRNNIYIYICNKRLNDVYLLYILL